MNTFANLLFDGKNRLYLLEDKDVTVLSSALRNWQADVQKFDSVQALLLACETKKPDLLIIDYELYESNSDDSSPYPDALFDCPIIRVTEKADIKNRLSAIREGCSGLVAKPVDEKELFNTIESLLQANSPDPYRVLIVDDDEDAVEYHAALLEQVGIVVEKLTLPLHCLDVMAGFKPDLLLLDIDMPEMTGIELSQIIRQFDCYSYIPIIFLSLETDLKKQQAAMQFGGEYFFTKPVKPERFQVFIESRLKYARQASRLHHNLNRSLLLSESQRIALDHHAIVSIADIKGDIIYVNNNFCEISGYTSAELIGGNHRLLKSYMHSDNFYEDLWHTIATGNVWQGEICNLNKQGKEYWVDSTIVPFMNEEGVPYQYVSVRTDITTIRNNEKRLKVSQNFANIGTWDWNIKTGDLLWSERIAPLFGYTDSRVETTYENFLAAIHADDRDDVVAAINACVEKDELYDIEHRVAWEDGTVHWLRETGNVIRNHKGESLHMLGVVQDITSRKTAQNMLAESEQRMRSQMDSMSEGMFGIDMNGQTIFVNQAACVMLGYSHDQLISEPIAELILADQDKSLFDSVFLQREHNRTSEAEFVCAGGKVIPVEYSSMSVVEHDEVKSFVVTFHDITERRASERAIITAKEQAEHANKAKSQFLSSMSHELRTPMNAIMGFGQLLQIDTSSPLSEQQADYLSEILKAGQHLLELINEVLDLSKIESGMTQMTIEPVLLFEVISECISLITPAADKKNIKVKFLQHDTGSTSTDLMVLADQLRLRQIFLNLLSNAVKYNLENGSVLVDCEIKEEGICSVNIKDTGFGMNTEQLDALFQPFNRLGLEASEIEGTGMGLVITKNLVEMMGGVISCKSVPGKGSVFTVDIGMTFEDEAVPALTSDTLADPLVSQEHGFHILYIEDNPVNIRLMAQLFAKEKGLHLSTVHEPLLGLSIVAENKPDLILLDINLPNMSGYLVLEELRKLFGENYPVVAVSANATDNDIKKGLKAGFSDYVTKPINVEFLLNTIYKLLKIEKSNG
ncbi:MAG: response regulator [Gammaproteobacteria bacterium]|nr:response regulator [Gammaproteobacteria bacterium]